MSAAIQKNREFQFVSPLGPDVLLFYRMHGTERLGGLFEYELDLLSTDPNLSPDRILGQGATLKVLRPDGGWRNFNGIVSRFGHYGAMGEYAYYRATLRPWLWLLTRTANCRIFQAKTAPDIIKQVLREKGFCDFEERLSRTYPVREYCVQYRESDFNFVSRLLEEEGIYYFFEHAENQHKLVFADSPGAHRPVPGYEELPFFEPGNSEQRERDHVYEWSFVREVLPVQYVLEDFDFQKPSADLQVRSRVPREHERAEFEIFDFPGNYREAGAGEGYANIRIHELQSQFHRVSGQANARGLTPGARFGLTHFSREDQNGAHLLVSAQYQFQSNDYFGTGGSDAPQPFQCSFTAIPADQVYGPPRVTPKPTVQGPQTAIVVGKAGEEIWTDEHGRVKVLFHWDREGKQRRDETCSCWVRVSHPWAGKNWGMVAIPRIGQEVIVDFIEGDPDRPIVTGRVYNAEQTPPYVLPANATQSGILSRSSKGGSGANANEIRFEDKLGAEQLSIHAEKDQDISVENDESHSVGHDRSKTVGNDETTQVQHDRTETVGNNENISIGVDRTETVGADETVSIGANQSVSVGANQSLSVGANQSISVGANRTDSVTANETVSVGANRSVSVGGAKSETVALAKAETIGLAKALSIGLGYQVSVGAEMNTTVGGFKTEQVVLHKDETIGLSKTLQTGVNYSLDVGDTYDLTAGNTINLHIGGSSLSMSKDGKIEIYGDQEIILQCGGSSQIKIDKSRIELISGSGTLTLDAAGATLLGALVKIN